MLLDLISIWNLAILVILLLVTLDYYRRRGLPPGPYGLPFLGYVLKIDRSRMSLQMNELCREHRTDILSVPLPGPPIIVLNSYELLKEVFQKRTDVTDRHNMTFLQAFDPEYTGVVTTWGRMWKEARRFSISMLRDFGMGRSGAEERIENESRILNLEIAGYEGNAFDPKPLINKAVSNIICCLVFGQRYDYQDKDFTSALSGMNNLLGSFSDTRFMFALKYKLSREYLIKEKFQFCQENYDMFSNFVRKRIEEHQNSYSGIVTDLISGFINEMESGKDPEVFNVRMLQSLITDYFLAASETTYTTICWGILSMAAYPEIQRKVQEELDRIVFSRPINASDRKNTPYTDAVVCEFQRHYTLIQLGAAHSNRNGDVEVRGYRIPEGGIVMANLHQIHHEKDIWKNPDEFDPENFLENGEFRYSEKLVPFSVGRRACAGEALARMEVYLFFAGIVKDFSIKLENDDVVADMRGIAAGTYQPKPFEVRMIPRKMS